LVGAWRFFLTLCFGLVFGLVSQVPAMLRSAGPHTAQRVVPRRLRLLGHKRKIVKEFLEKDLV